MCVIIEWPQRTTSASKEVSNPEVVTVVVVESILQIRFKRGGGASPLTNNGLAMVMTLMEMAWIKNCHYLPTNQPTSRPTQTNQPTNNSNQPKILWIHSISTF